jgi:hypothetical protein
VRGSKFLAVRAGEGGDPGQMPKAILHPSLPI